jgi:hypothetical protein
VFRDVGTYQVMLKSIRGTIRFEPKDEHAPESPKPASELNAA